MLHKKITSAFNKQIVLLGTEKDGTNVWLEFPSWDCSWYWGFGYLESYTNNINPEKAKDINCHTHFDGLEIYGSGGYMPKPQHGYSRLITSWVLEKADRDTLVVLFRKFYNLKKMADAAHQTNPNYWKQINTIDIVEVMTEILKLLHPHPDVVKIAIPHIVIKKVN